MSRVKLEPMGDGRPRKGGRDQVHASALSCAVTPRVKLGWMLAPPNLCHSRSQAIAKSVGNLPRWWSQRLPLSPSVS
jgi:hypothetical protein